MDLESKYCYVTPIIILLLLQIYITQHCVHVYKYITVNIYGRDLLIFIRVTSREIYPNRKQMSTFA
jgi:hypothetical protein